ncbi:hypothetical protein [Hymenobacter psychrophilus]|uniref:Curlin associated repeat-containing protein n=1 Tax=Hymenobacter psychrophilus TaxID=651662 RepID=A0A1H3AV02_9BACT|nr:hypothetical protein [Hymenobacter psychrophilus]SDX33201.1 hypothetical protein SAMN04488069_10145 [Hymenobacter psychrophilus]
MKKVQLLAAAAVLFASSAYAQSGTRETFRAINACIGCEPAAPMTSAASQTNPNGTPALAAIDNCSVVVQGGSGLNRGDDNRAVVDQSGTGNRAALYQREGDRNYGLQVQTGASNQAQAVVWGDRNTTLQLQRGDRNKAGINVDQIDGQAVLRPVANGNRNWAEQNQAGNDNNADIKTYGNDNYASQNQVGNRNSGSIFQRVNGSAATQSQVGNDNIAVTQQGGLANVASSISGQRSCIEQGGDSNQALVMQNRR